MTQVHVEEIVGLRALIGVENADGKYRARPVHYGGCPDVIVPALSHLVLQVCEGSEQLALDKVLGCDWTRIYLRPEAGGHPAELVLEPSPNLAYYRPAVANVAEGKVGDLQWAYLFGDRRLHVYLGVHRLHGGQAWEPWACWPLTELPSVPHEELLDVRNRGLSRQQATSDEARYAAEVAKRHGWDPRKFALAFDLLSTDERAMLGLDPTGRFVPHYRSSLTARQRETLREARKRGEQ